MHIAKIIKSPSSKWALDDLCSKHRSCRRGVNVSLLGKAPGNVVSAHEGVLSGTETALAHDS